ncbi:MAG: rhomboid family intramembrane serine protease [Gemmatimonadota bacterium]|nr:MAG: rhomboid family intramembrane serine protease [Gemmatimonadota bacterium]
MRSRPLFSLTPWVRGLLVANTVVWVLTISVFTGPWFHDLFAFDPAAAGRRWWTFVTYMFVHAGFLHLALNMLMLFFFGSAVEERMGGPAFALYYLVCGLGGTAFAFALSLFLPVTPFVGASAAVFGISLAFATNWPNAPIYLFPIPAPVRAKWLVVFLATVTLVVAISASEDGGVASLAHLGGFLFGFIYVRSEAAVVRRARAAARNRLPAHVVPQRRAGESRWKEPQPTPTEPGEGRSEELDRVLDKISATGIESLTLQERRLLDEMSRDLREH